MDPKKSFSDNENIKEAFKAALLSCAAEEFQAAREEGSQHSLGGRDDSHSLHSHHEESVANSPPSLKMSFSVEGNSPRRHEEEGHEQVERRESEYDLDEIVNLSARTNSSVGKSFVGGFSLPDPAHRDGVDVVSPVPSTLPTKEGEMETKTQKEHLSYAELRRKRAQSNAYYHRRGPSLSVHLTSPFCGASLGADWNVGFSPSSTINTFNLADFPNSTSPVRSPRGYGEVMAPNAPVDNMEMSFRTIAELSVSLGTTVREAVYPGIRELFPKLPAHFIISRERVTVPPAADMTGEENKLLGVGQFGPVLEGQLYPPHGSPTPYEGGLFTGRKNSALEYSSDFSKTDVSRKIPLVTSRSRCRADSSPEIMYQQPINRTNRAFYHSGVSQAFTGAPMKSVVPLSEGKGSSIGSTSQSTAITMNEWMSKYHRHHRSRRPTNGAQRRFSPTEVAGRQRRTTLFKQSFHDQRGRESHCETVPNIASGASNIVSMDVQTVGFCSIASTQTPTTDANLGTSTALNGEADSQSLHRSGNLLGSSPPFQGFPSSILGAPVSFCLPRDNASSLFPSGENTDTKCNADAPMTAPDAATGKRRPSFLLPSPLYEAIEETQKLVTVTTTEQQQQYSPRIAIIKAESPRSQPRILGAGIVGSGSSTGDPLGVGKYSQATFPFHGLSARTLTDIGSDNDSSTLAPSSQYHPPTHGSPTGWSGDYQPPFAVGTLDSGSVPRKRRTGQRYFDSYQSFCSRYPPTPEKKIFGMGEVSPILLDDNGSPMQDMLDVSSPISMQSQHTHLPFNKNTSFCSLPTVSSPLCVNTGSMYGGQPRMSGSLPKTDVVAELTPFASPTQPIQISVLEQQHNNRDSDKVISLSEVHLAAPTQPPALSTTAEDVFRKAILEAGKHCVDDEGTDEATTSSKKQNYLSPPVPVQPRSMSSSSGVLSPSGGCPPYIQHLHANPQKMPSNLRRLGHSTDYESSSSISGSPSKWANLMLGSSPLPLCSPNMLPSSNAVSPVQGSVCKAFPPSSQTRDSFLDTPERHQVETSKTTSFTTGSIEAPVPIHAQEAPQGNTTGDESEVLSGSKKQPIPIIHTRANLSSHDLQYNRNSTMLPISSTLNPGMAGSGGPCRHHYHHHHHSNNNNPRQVKYGSPSSPTSCFSSSSSDSGGEQERTSSASPLMNTDHRSRRRTMQAGKLMVLPMTEFRNVSPISWEDGSWDEHTGAVEDEEEEEESCSVFSSGAAAGQEGQGVRTGGKQRMESSTYVGNCVPYRSVAVKIFSKMDLDDIQRTQGFMNEVMMGSQLRHPSLVNWLGVAEDLSDFYLIMDILPSGTLEKLIKDLHGDPAERWRRASRLMADIVLALEYLQDGTRHPYDPRWQENGSWAGMRHSSTPSQASCRSGERWSAAPRAGSERKQSMDGGASSCGGRQSPMAQHQKKSDPNHWEGVTGDIEIQNEESKPANSDEDFPVRPDDHSGIVLHRDIKPSNFMLTGDGHLRLGDFGTACFLGDEEANTYSGTVSYMSNEMIVNNKAGRYSDLWSAGCVLYEILEGTMLFFGATPYLVHHQIKNFNPDNLKYPSLSARTTVTRSEDASPNGQVNSNVDSRCHQNNNSNSISSSINSGKQAATIQTSTSTVTNTLSTTYSNTCTSSPRASNTAVNGASPGDERGNAPEDWSYEAAAMDLVAQLLQPDPTKRLGSDETGGFEALKRHPFFDGIEWDNVYGTNNFLLWEASAKHHSTPTTPLDSECAQRDSHSAAMTPPRENVPSRAAAAAADALPSPSTSTTPWWLPLPDLSSFTVNATAGAASLLSSTSTATEGCPQRGKGVFPGSSSPPPPPPPRPAVTFGARLPPLLPPPSNGNFSTPHSNERLILQPGETILFYSLVVVLGDPRFSSCRVLLMLTQMASAPRLLFVHWQTKELLLAVSLPERHCLGCEYEHDISKLSSSSISRYPIDQKKYASTTGRQRPRHHSQPNGSRYSHCPSTTKHSPIIPNAPTGVFCGSPSGSPSHRPQSILLNGAGQVSLTSMEKSVATTSQPPPPPCPQLRYHQNAVNVEIESKHVFCVSISGKDAFRCRDECGQADLWKQRVLDAMKCSCELVRCTNTPNLSPTQH